MEKTYKICNITPIEVEYLQNVPCYITTATNLWQANYIWISEYDLYKSVYKEYSKQELLRYILSAYDIKHLVDCGVPKSRISKEQAIKQIITEAHDYVASL